MKSSEQFKLIEGDCLAVLSTLESASVDSVVTDPPAGIAFMGKEWDKDRGGRDAWVGWMTEVMVECLRVLKPGGHALIWAIPRTSHWTATAVENAGFEIRDVVTHLFGSGFPKSLDVSKAIDKAAGAERKVVGINPNHRKTASGDVHLTGTMVGEPHTGDGSITAPATPDAEKWQGFGTALKPACEFWILCRKPLGEKTVAANVLKHGTGALNIDGCRIGTDSPRPMRERDAGRLTGHAYQGALDGSFVGSRAVENSMQGRFPANLVLSDDVTEMLDEQAGNPVSRFFYVAKASRSDKGADNTHPTVKSTALMRYLIKLVTPPGGLVLDPFAGSGSTGVASLCEGFDFLGIEQDISYIEIANRRLQQASENISNGSKGDTE